MTASYIQDSDFNDIVNQSTLVVVDYTAPWCGPCRLVGPLIDKLADEYAGKAQVCKMDVDNNKENAKKYGIRSIPAVLFFKDGEVVERVIGKADYQTFTQAVEKHL